MTPGSWESTGGSRIRLTEQLAEREIELDQWRDAQLLMKEFIRGQMARHYWGGFSPSLADLGLTVPQRLDTRVDRDRLTTTLNVMPRRGSEAFLAGVERRGGRLTSWSCRGRKDQISERTHKKCPEGWTLLDVKQLE
ncbi:putative thymidylate synthase [Synechococcus sp. BOUM118]|nr:putative thymidylate synthase [Synechococcus sp. BOUM118]